MDNKELVDVWRKDFEKWFIGDLDISLKRDKEGNYTFMNAYSAWNAWLAAKRSQSSVVLPKDYGNGKIEAKTVHDALTAAGIKYTVKD